MEVFIEFTKALLRVGSKAAESMKINPPFFEWCKIVCNFPFCASENDGPRGEGEMVNVDVEDGFKYRKFFMQGHNRLQNLSSRQNIYLKLWKLLLLYIQRTQQISEYNLLVALEEDSFLLFTLARVVFVQTFQILCELLTGRKRKK